MRGMLFAGWLLLPFASSAAAGEFALRPEQDQSGASLPAGAVRRLGSTAYRLPARCTALTWSEDKLLALTWGEAMVVGPDGEMRADEAQKDPGQDVSESAKATWHGDEVHIVDLRGREKILYGAGGDVVDVARLPDGRLAALSDVESTIGCIIGSTDARLSIWEPHRRRPRQTFLQGCTAERLAPFGAAVAVVCTDRLSLLELGEGVPEREVFVHDLRNFWGSADGQALLLSTRLGYEIWHGERVERGSSMVSAAAVHGEQIVFGGERFIELNGPPVRFIPLEDGKISGLVWHPDGGAVAACVGHRIGWWDAETGEVLTPFVGHAEDVTAVALSSDGRRAVSGSQAGDVIVWDTQRGSMLARFLLPKVTRVDEVAWSDGIVTARAGMDTLRVVAEPDWASGPPKSYRIEGQQDGTVLIFEMR